MRSNIDFDTGLTRLGKLLAEFPPGSAHWNEAQNRFQFIDRLLTDCLGWEHPDISVEEYDEGGGRADYLLGKQPRAVLEAKKQALPFGDLPTGSRSLVRRLQPHLKASKNLAAAVHQVIPYCAYRGAPIAVVCNGPQMVIFQAILVGAPPTEGECYFFDGFESYLRSFDALWTLLSPEGVSENRALRALDHLRNPRLPSKASEAIADPHSYRYRSPFQENLRALSSLLLEEIEDNPALRSSFYEQCYVPMEANNRHLLLSKRAIAARYNKVDDAGVLPGSLREAATLTPGGQLQISDPATISATGARPIVVIGDVGVGKTSFFENLYEKLESDAKANTYFININLGLKASLATSVRAYVLDAVPRVLRERYGVDIASGEFVEAIYDIELRAFDNGIYGSLRDVDPVEYQKQRIRFLGQKIEMSDQHLLRAFRHLSRGRGRQIILVLDNADQRSFETQQEAFLVAQEIAATQDVLLFVALRPSTFFRSKLTGALSGYQNKVLTISPPPADEVVKKRLMFAVKVAEGKIAPAALAGVRLQLGSVVSFLNATLRSIGGNADLRQFLSNITGGNTREVVELVTGFFGSPNVDSRKIVEIEETRGGYKVPLHEFTKHALLGDYAYFNARSSTVAFNLFDVATPDRREHFLASCIVAYLSSNNGLKDNDGFLRGDRILEEGVRLGFTEQQTRSALRRLAEKKLIETPHAHYRETQVDYKTSPEEFLYRSTSVGIYHVRFWTGAFTFLDATSTDTPIFDATARETIFDLASSHQIEDRYKKACAFRSYLEQEWNDAIVPAAYYDFVQVAASQRDSFEAVHRVLRR